MMEENKIQETSPAEGGQSMIEFAFGLVIVLILLAGIVDLARLFFTQMALRDAAQEGALYGSICPNGDGFSPARIEDRVRKSSNMPLNLADTATVRVRCSYLFDTNNDGDYDDVGEQVLGCDGSPAAANGDGIKVEVLYDDFTITMPFVGTMIGTQTLDLGAEATDTILRDSCP